MAHFLLTSVFEAYDFLWEFQTQGSDMQASLASWQDCNSQSEPHAIGGNKDANYLIPYVKLPLIPKA